MTAATCLGWCWRPGLLLFSWRHVLTIQPLPAQVIWKEGWGYCFSHSFISAACCQGSNDEYCIYIHRAQWKDHETIKGSLGGHYRRQYQKRENTLSITTDTDLFCRQNLVVKPYLEFQHVSVDPTVYRASHIKSSRNDHNIKMAWTPCCRMTTVLYTLVGTADPIRDWSFSKELCRAVVLKLFSIMYPLWKKNSAKYPLREKMLV